MAFKSLVKLNCLFVVYTFSCGEHSSNEQCVVPSCGNPWVISGVVLAVFEGLDAVPKGGALHLVENAVFSKS